jgi:hypothetical protein
MLLFEIVAGHPPPPPRAAEDGGEVILPPDVPTFVSEMIEGGLGPRAGNELSFIGIIDTLEANGFGIVAGVDSDEVSAFVIRAESVEESWESE